MPEQQLGAQIATLAERMEHFEKAVDRATKMLEALESRFVLKELHEFKVSSLEARVSTLERQRIEDERQRKEDVQNGGILGWLVNVNKVFGGFLTIASVIGVLVMLVLSWASRK